MGRQFINKETGKVMSRLEIVEAFEKEQGKLSAAQFELLLDEIEHYEVYGYWRVG
jgi:hypothetical protein